MKKLIFTMAAAMFVAGSILSGCTSQAKKIENAEQKVQDAQDNVTDAKDNLDKTKDGSVSEFQKFKDESNTEINENEKRIADLRIEMRSEKKSAKERDEKKVDDLESRNHDLKVKLEDYHDDGKSDWREFKTEFKHDLDGLGKAFKDITVRNTK